VRYDPAFHFPAHAEGDVDQALDAGFLITIAEFKRE